MKANELMIGDWVKLDFYDTPYGDEEDAVWKNGKITAIHHGHWVDVNFSGVLDECDIEIDDIQPIPLTPEILERNGWKCFDTYHKYTHYRHPKAPFGILLRKEGGCTIEFRADESGGLAFLFILYVHQLQHALRFCGIDKEIEL